MKSKINLKKQFSEFFPNNLKDISFWLLSLLALFPIFRMFTDNINYMMMNFALLCIAVIVFIFKVCFNLVNKKKIVKIRSYALLAMLVMLLLLFVSSIFSCNPRATWLGIYKNYHQETSVFQFAFFVVVSVLAILLDKENIKSILFEFITVALVIIIVHISNQKYDIVFVNRNFAGYYLCTTATMAIGLLLFSKNVFEAIYLSIVTLMHFIVLILNSSFGPILAVICYLFLGFFYFLIHKRKVFLRFLGVCLACIVVFSLFDFVPKLAKYKCERQTVIDQLYDTSVVVLNKIGIIKEKEYKKLEQGVDNDGNKKDDIVVGDSVIIQSGITAGSKGYDRFDMWQRCLENMKEKPLFGVGTGAWWTYNPDMPYSSPHNEYLQFGASFGIPALIIYVGIFIYVLIKFRMKHKKLDDLAFVVTGAMIVYLIQSTFGILQPFTAQLLYLMLGFAIKFVDVKNKENEGKDVSKDVQENKETVNAREEKENTKIVNN